MTPTQEQQVYKLLELLNSALKSNSVTKKEVRSTSDSRNNPTASQKAGKDAKAAFQAVSATMDKTNKLLQGFNTNLDTVSGGANNVSKSFLQLNGEINTFIGTIKGFSLPKIGESGPVSPIFNDAGIISAINNASKSIVDGISIPSATFDDSNIVNAINNIKQPVIDDKNIIQAMKSASITTVFDDTNIVKKLDSNRISNETHLSITRKAIVSSINDNSRNIIDAINKNNAASMAQTANLLNGIQQQNASATTPANTSPTTAPPVPQTTPNPPANLTQATAAAQAAASAASSTSNLTSATTTAASATKYHGMSLKQIAGSMLQANAVHINSMDGVSMAMDGMKKVVNELTKQFVALANVGMGSIGNIYDLNVAALKSGMSMREYQELFVGNMELAARTMTIDNFHALTSANNGLLARIGVFGADAKKLQVEIAQTATTLGVSQEAIPDAANSLVNTFRRLNKNISMSSQEFLESVKAVRDNNHSVNEMSGLASNQRPARLAELVAIQNHGRSLGLSAIESEKLGKALMEQRYASVKDRYKEAANLQQMGAVLGMSADGNRAGELSRKRNKTEAETKEFASILSNMNVQMNRQVENSDNVGVEYQRDVIYDQLSASTKEIMMGGTRALTANESAALNQAAFGKEVGLFGQAVGMFVKYAEGLKGNDLVSGTLGILGGIALTVFANPLKAILGQVWTLGQKLVTPSNFVGPPKPSHLVLGGNPPTPPTVPPTVPGSANPKSTWISKITEPVKNVLGAIKNMFTTSIPALGKLGGFVSSAGSMLGSSLKIATGFLRGIPFLGQFVAMAMELFTGDLRNAMSGTGSIVNTIASMVLNIPMSLVNLVLDGLEWIFGDNLLAPVRQVFETMAADVMLIINGIFAGIINAISWFTDFLPKDSKLRQGMDSYAKQTEKVFDENLETVKQVGSGQTTLAKISDKNKKTAEATAATADKSAVETTNAANKIAKTAADFNNTQYDSMVTKARVIEDARNLVGANSGQSTTPATATPEIAKTVLASDEAKSKTTSEKNADGTPKVNSVSSAETKMLESESSTALLKKIHETLLQMLLLNQMQFNEENDTFNDMMTRPLFQNKAATAGDMTQRLLSQQ